MNQTFFNEIRCKFNLRQPKNEHPTRVFAVISYKGKQTKVSTGLKVYPLQWNKRKQCAVIDYNLSKEDINNNEILNTKIKELKTLFDETKTYLCNHIETNNPLQTIQQRMKSKKKETVQFEEVFEEVISTKNKVTANSYRYTWNVVKCVFDVDSYDKVTFESVRNFIDSKQNKGVGTVKSYMKAISLVIREINLRDIHDYSNLLSKLSSIKFTSPKVKDDGKVALSEEQIKLVENHKCKNDYYERVKDAFLFMCYTGLRKSDACKNFNDCKDEALKNGEFTIVQKKVSSDANAVVSLKLDNRIKPLLDRNDWDFEMPISNIGTYIRKALDGIKEFEEQRVTLKKKIITGTVTETKTFLECISGHTGRRTFITNKVLQGWTPDKIILYTGHANTNMIRDIYDKTTRQQKRQIAVNDKPKSNILDMFFAYSSIKELTDTLPINQIYGSEEIKGIISTLKSIKGISKAVSIYEKSDRKEDFTNKVREIDRFVWNVGKHFADTSLYVIFQSKMKQFGIIDEVMEENLLDEIWQNEIANEQ